MKTEPLLAPAFRLRPLNWADSKAVAQVIYAACEADGDVIAAMTAEELESEWRSEGFNLETDAFVVETADGRVAGYGEFFNDNQHAKLSVDWNVHPQFRDQGVDVSLLKRLEERAREEIPLAEADLRVFLRSTISARDIASHKIHTDLGYAPIRYQWRMEIKLDGQPPAPSWPEGVELRPFNREQHAKAVWQANNEAFRDHWGSRDATFEEFVHGRFDDPEYDPALWVIAWDGEEVAGFSLNRYRMGIGWIRSLGVRRPWRKKGLGLALLHHSFGEFYKRGMKTIGLGVDASNPTGATRLYQRAGMYVASEFLTFEKELRPGRSLDE
ncbi:MAG: GNAT family N-acetyltransferase [Chloroflexi bacterium]|nr:GNAT family N-acetyltransferase [Chloroflexota bacterium]